MFIKVFVGQNVSFELLLASGRPGALLDAPGTADAVMEYMRKCCYYQLIHAQSIAGPCIYILITFNR